MTVEEIIKANKMIAIFLGAKMIVENYYGINIIKFPDESTKDLWGLKYHKSWDWLMPVVDHISKELQGKFHLYNKYLLEDESREDFLVFRMETIEKLYIAVVEFIKWYNQNKIK